MISAVEALRAELVLREEQARAVQEKLMELKRTVHTLLHAFPACQVNC